MNNFKLAINNNESLQCFLYNEKNPNTVIIMCHGFSGSSSGIMFPKIAEELSQRFLVCRFDFRGQGESDGDFYTSSISRKLEDLDFIISHIKTQFNPQNIILLGHSFGCAIALLHAQKNPVQGIISLSGEGDLQKAINYEFSKEQLQEFENKGETKYENWTYNGRMDLLGKQFLDDMKKYSTIQAVKNIKCPILYIHGTNDDVIPHSATEEMYNLTTSEKEIILMEGVDHMFNVFSKNPKVEDMISYVKNWLERKF